MTISNDMFIDLLNIIVETIDEFNIFIFERVMQSGLLNEQILLDPVLQEQFVEVIKDRLGNKDRFYIVEKYKEYVIFEYLEKGFERRNNNEVNESSCITYLKEKLESFYLLKHAQEIVSSVRNADQNMSLGMIKEEDLKTIKGNIFGLLDDLTFEADYGEIKLSNIDQMERNRYIFNKESIIPTFSPKLNSYIGGGAFPKKLHLVAAPTGAGKSVILCKLGKHGVDLGKTVYHFTFELNRHETMCRYWSIISGMPYLQLFTETPIDKIEKHITAYVREHGDGLIIKENPPHSMTKDMISLYIKRKMLTGEKKPDLIIVDYADYMKSSLRSKNQEQRLDLNFIYIQLRILASEFSCPVWTASQLNREGIKRVESSNQDLADSAGKENNSDLILIARQSEEEKKRKKLRLFIGKNRMGDTGIELVYKTKYAYMDLEESEEEALTDLSDIDFSDQKGILG